MKTIFEISEAGRPGLRASFAHGIGTLLVLYLLLIIPSGAAGRGASPVIQGVASSSQQQGTQLNPNPTSCPLTDDAAIRKMADDFRDAYNRGDAAQVAALYTDSAYYLTQHYADGIIEGRKNIQAYVQRGVDAHFHMDSIEVLKTNCACATPMPSLKARIEGAHPTKQCNFAYALARYQSTNDGHKAMGVNLLVLRKFQNTWRIVAHESAVPDPATAIKKLE